LHSTKRNSNRSQRDDIEFATDDEDDAGVNSKVSPNKQHVVHEAENNNKPSTAVSTIYDFKDDDSDDEPFGQKFHRWISIKKTNSTPKKQKLKRVVLNNSSDEELQDREVSNNDSVPKLKKKKLKRVVVNYSSEEDFEPAFTATDSFGSNLQLTNDKTAAKVDSVKTPISEALLKKCTDVKVVVERLPLTTNHMGAKKSVLGKEMEEMAGVSTPPVQSPSVGDVQMSSSSPVTSAVSGWRSEGRLSLSKLKGVAEQFQKQGLRIGKALTSVTQGLVKNEPAVESIGSSSVSSIPANTDPPNIVQRSDGVDQDCASVPAAAADLVTQTTGDSSIDVTINPEHKSCSTNMNMHTEKRPDLAFTVKLENTCSVGTVNQNEKTPAHATNTRQARKRSASNDEIFDVDDDYGQRIESSDDEDYCREVSSKDWPVDKGNTAKVNDSSCSAKVTEAANRYEVKQEVSTLETEKSKSVKQEIDTAEQRHRTEMREVPSGASQSTYSTLEVIDLCDSDDGDEEEMERKLFGNLSQGLLEIGDSSSESDIEEITLDTPVKHQQQDNVVVYPSYDVDMDCTSRLVIDEHEPMYGEDDNSSDSSKAQQVVAKRANVFDLLQSGLNDVRVTHTSAVTAAADVVDQNVKSASNEHAVPSQSTAAKSRDVGQKVQNEFPDVEFDDGKELMSAPTLEKPKAWRAAERPEIDISAHHLQELKEKYNIDDCTVQLPVAKSRDASANKKTFVKKHPVSSAPAARHAHAKPVSKLPQSSTAQNSAPRASLSSSFYSAASRRELKRRTELAERSQPPRPSLQQQQPMNKKRKVSADVQSKRQRFQSGDAVDRGLNRGIARAREQMKQRRVSTPSTAVADGAAAGNNLLDSIMAGQDALHEEMRRPQFYQEADGSSSRAGASPSRQSPSYHPLATDHQANFSNGSGLGGGGSPRDRTTVEPTGHSEQQHTFQRAASTGDNANHNRAYQRANFDPRTVAETVSGKAQALAKRSGPLPHPPPPSHAFNHSRSLPEKAVEQRRQVSEVRSGDGGGRKTSPSYQAKKTPRVDESNISKGAPTLVPPAAGRVQGQGQRARQPEATTAGNRTASSGGSSRTSSETAIAKPRSKPPGQEPSAAQGQGHHYENQLIELILKWNVKWFEEQSKCSTCCVDSEL
jgi:hypothetical protein